MSPMLRAPLTFELALLGFLQDGPLHGYEVHRRLSDPAGLGQVWRIKQSHLYALLARLEEDGYLASRIKAQESRPPRKLFQLTRSGRAAFAHWLQSPALHGRDVRLGFMAKLYFAQQAGPAAAAALVGRQKAACLIWLAEQQALARAASSFERQVRQYRIGQIESMLAWLDQCLPAEPETGAP